MLLQTSLFVIPKISDISWKELMDGIARNKTPLIYSIWNVFDIKKYELMV